MTPAAPTSSTARELCAAILAAPDEDTHRLAYADFAEEEGDVEHAELIRVQCELAGITWKDQTCKLCGVRCEDSKAKYCPRGHGDPDGKNSHEWQNTRRDTLRSRERALLPTLRARLMPACPGYHGDGHGWPDCVLCGAGESPAYGICPGDIVRGFPVLRIPLSVCGREEMGRCKMCYGRGKMQKAEIKPFDFRMLLKSEVVPRDVMFKTVEVDCQACNGTGRKLGWQPAPWLAAARERGATVEVSDREPIIPVPPPDSQQRSKLLTWFDASQTNIADFSHHIPHSLWSDLEGGEEVDGFKYLRGYRTTAAAVAALGRAVMGITSGSSKESSAC